MLVLLALIGVTTSQKHPGSITAIPGAILEKKGTILPITSFVEVKFSLAPLKDFTQTIAIQRSALTDLSIDVGISTELSDNHKIILQRAIRTLQEKITKMIGPQPKTKRAKRGLLNIIGEASSVLFGTVDEATLDGKLAEYDEKLKTVTASYTTSAQSISTLQHNINELHRVFTYLYNHTASDKALTSTEKFAELTFLFSEYSTTFTDVANNAKSFSRAVIRAAHGTVDTTLISPQDISRIFATLHVGHNAPLFPADNILLYSSISSFVIKSGLNIIIPLRPTSNLTAYLTHPFPHQLNDSTIVLDSPPLLLFTDLGLEVTSTETNSLDTCLRLSSSLYVCLAPTWTYIHSRTSCSNTLFRYLTCHESNNYTECMNNVHNNFTAYCSFKEIQPTPHPFTLPLPESTFIFYFRPTPATVT